MIVEIECLEYGKYYFNPNNITFISTGELRNSPTTATQLFLHFCGGKESAMIWVSEPAEVIAKLNAST